MVITNRGHQNIARETGQLLHLAVQKEFLGRQEKVCGDHVPKTGLPAIYHASHVAKGKTTSRKCLHNEHIGVASKVMGRSLP